MPWTCPACSTRLSQTSILPTPNRVYQCPVCRLQMTFDLAIKKMRPLPPEDPENGAKTRNIA